MKRRASELKIGDVIMPPDREVRLWMRRSCQEKGLPESALYLTITEISEGAPDAKGRWLLVTADQAREWFEGREPYPFKFKARPETPWAAVR